MFRLFNNTSNTIIEANASEKCSQQIKTLLWIKKGRWEKNGFSIWFCDFSPTFFCLFFSLELYSIFFLHISLCFLALIKAPLLLQCPSERGSSVFCLLFLIFFLFVGQDLRGSANSHQGQEMANIIIKQARCVRLFAQLTNKGYANELLLESNILTAGGIVFLQIKIRPVFLDGRTRLKVIITKELHNKSPYIFWFLDFGITFTLAIIIWEWFHPKKTHILKTNAVLLLV